MTVPLFVTDGEVTLIMTEYFISYYVKGCPYVGDGEYVDGELFVDDHFDSYCEPSRCGRKACSFCSSFKECPREKKRKNNLYSRCSIGDLSDDDVKHFIRESGIESANHIGIGYDLVLQSKNQIPLDTLEERIAHQRLLEQFDDDYKRHAPYTYEYVCCPLCEYKRLAEMIIKVREHTPDEEDIADIVAHLTSEGKGFWVSQQEYADAMDYEVETLRTYRETRHNPRYSKKAPMIGMDKSGNIFKKTSDKNKAPHLYFLRRNADFQNRD